MLMNILLAMKIPTRPHTCACASTIAKAFVLCNNLLLQHWKDRMVEKTVKHTTGVAVVCSIGNTSRT